MNIILKLIIKLYKVVDISVGVVVLIIESLSDVLFLFLKEKDLKKDRVEELNYIYLEFSDGIVVVLE